MYKHICINTHNSNKTEHNEIEQIKSHIEMRNGLQLGMTVHEKNRNRMGLS